MPSRFASWLIALAAVSVLPSMAGCSSDGSASSSSTAAESNIPVMLDGLYVSQNPSAGPYAQISFIGYLRSLHRGAKPVRQSGTTGAAMNKARFTPAAMAI